MVRWEALAPWSFDNQTMAYRTILRLFSWLYHPWAIVSPTNLWFGINNFLSFSFLSLP